MELLEWFQQLNVHERSLQEAISESSLFIAYAILSIFLKKPVYLLAFFMCYLLINASFMQPVQEYQCYLLMIIIYSYVYQSCETRFSKVSCVIIIFISLMFSVDAFFYGVDGYHGEIETFIYNNITSIALFAHLLFISSLIDYSRIRDYLRGLFDLIVYIASSGYNMLYILQKTKHQRRFK